MMFGGGQWRGYAEERRATQWSSQEMKGYVEEWHIPTMMSEVYSLEIEEQCWVVKDIYMDQWNPVEINKPGARMSFDDCSSLSMTGKNIKVQAERSEEKGVKCEALWENISRLGSEMRNQVKRRLMCWILDMKYTPAQHCLNCDDNQKISTAPKLNTKAIWYNWKRLYLLPYNATVTGD